MAKLLKLRRGTTAQHGSFTGAEGEVTIDTTKDTDVVHDGSTQGGTPLLKEDMSNLPAGTIDNADVNASAAIAGTKISPDFGSQDITTTGKIKFANVYSNESDLPSASTYHGMFAHVHSTGLAYYAHGGNWIKLAKLDAPDFTGGIDVTGAITSTGDVTITNAEPKISLTDSNDNSDFILLNSHGNFRIFDETNTAERFKIASDGTGTFAGNLDVGAGVDVTGEITGTGGITVASGVDADGALRANSSNSGKWVRMYGSAGTGRWDIYGHGANLRISDNDQTGSFVVDRNTDLNGGLDVTGNITVSGTVDGRDVAADGTKLDGIESGATADQSASEIATALNGQNVYTTGNIGRDSNDHIVFTDDSRLDVVIAGNNEFRFEADGDFHADGDITAFSTTVASDSRLKSDIHTINNALGIVGKLRGVSYKWLRDGRSDIGVIAQEVEEVIPEIVKTKTTLGLDGQEEMKTVDYGKIVGVLINAINELKEEVEELKNAKITG